MWGGGSGKKLMGDREKLKNFMNGGLSSEKLGRGHLLTVSRYGAVLKPPGDQM